ADIFTFFWVLGMSYTTKLLDGIDGLVSGITGIGFLILGFLSLNSIVHQPDTAFVCFILAGCFLGFLIFNFPPAKIFLGESGSIISGFLLGTIAIVAGGKVATTLLIFAIPVFDTFYVIISRIYNKKSPFSGDRRHLHYRLENLGFSNKQILLFMYLFTLIIGLSSLVFDGKLKLITFLALFFIGILLMLVGKKRV
ncbi:undecaprenyl/decaprenyl-phosphate alpha-N-acetylglucosaminyl 1-phosphate transferase, partial [bacterium]|nr:undecaprenyl/decaprenyl-phosphate alpha-N-acetylglucosaminyl 1-phosphate transferase [bacterium]